MNGRLLAIAVRRLAGVDDLVPALIVAAAVALERAILWRLWLTTRELLDELARRREHAHGGRRGPPSRGGRRKR